jgi:hypothetical protein
MPPKSSKTTDRKPMKTALLETPDESVVGTAVAVAVAVAVAAPAFVAGGATVAAAAVSDTRILDKISRDRSSQELKYLAGLSMLEQRVCFIAQDHLESSFDLGRSSGFIAWKKSDGGGGGGA